MSRLYALLGALLVIGGLVALVSQAWVLGSVLLLVGGCGLVAEIDQHRSPGHVPMAQGSSRNSTVALKEQVLSEQQTRADMAWGAGGG